MDMSCVSSILGLGRFSVEEWKIPTRFTVGLQQGLTQQDMLLLGQHAQQENIDPRELAARLIAEGLKRLRLAPVPDGNVSSGSGWGYPVQEEG